MNEKVEQSGSTSPDSKSILTSSSDTNRALATRDDEGYSKKESGSNVTSSPEPQSPSPRPLSSSDPDVEHAAPPGPPMEKGAEENFKPKTLKFWLIMMSTIFSMFLVALDRTIISTAIPQITDDFKSLGDIGWYGSGYMLTTAAFQLVFGRIYRFYDLRWTFLCCIIVFEIGSAICGAAPTSPVFIFGRAIAGIGSAGIFTGAMMVIMAMVPLHKRPMFQSLFGLTFGVASVAGPLLGGAFTERITWRWCFYINLPVGGAAFFCLFFFLKSPKKPQLHATIMEHIMRLDPLGTFFFIPSISCLVLALQWGGSQYPWSNWRIIVLFVFFALAALAFAAVQIKMPKTASLPVRVITQRSILAGTWFMVFLSGAMMLCVYYLPLWFQTTHNVSPVDSGIYTIPLVCSLIISGILSGALTQRIGYYVPSMILSASIMAVGEGLLTTFTPTTGSSHWIAYQFLTGFGLGFGMQTVGLAAQTVLPKDDVPVGIAITFFAQQLGGAIFVSVGQTILSTVLIDKLSGIPGLNPKIVINTGATDLHRVVPEEHYGAVVDAYNHAVTMIFYAALALTLSQLACALCMEWKSIKKGRQGLLAKKTAPKSDSVEG